MDTDLAEAVAWTEAVHDALRESADRHGADPDALMDTMSFVESLDPLAEADYTTDSFARAVEALALAYVADHPEARTTEAVETETVRTQGRVMEAKGTAPDGGRIYRVEILRYGDSKNGNRYTEAVMRRDAHRYEGAKAYDHHRTAEELRSSTLAGLVGSYRNVEATGDALLGDLHLLPSATHTAEALDASLTAQAAGLPPLVGISHDVMAQFKPATSGGRRVREAVAITAVQSADVVADPSAGGKAVRVVQGGIETTPNEGAEQTQESTMPVAPEDVLAALSSATPEQLAAHGLSRLGTPTTESVTPPVRTVESQRTVDGGLDKTSWMAQAMIRDKATTAGYGSAVETITSGLSDRITESDVDAYIASLKAAQAVHERAGLVPTVTAQVTRESRDKKAAALDALFAGDFRKGYRSFRDAYIDYTGNAPRIFGEDFNRTVLRESFGVGFDSARTTESLDASSWAQALGDSVTRRMMSEYSLDNLQTWRRIVRTVPVNDFRTQRRIHLGGYGTLPAVNEGAPYQPLTSPGDEEISYALTKRGGTEDVTLEMIANDDVRAITRIPTKLGRAAARTLYDFVWAFLSGNATYDADATALFHANHNNTDAASALTQSTLSVGRRKMIEQTAYGDTSEVLGLTPKYLVVPPELEELAFQLTRSAVAVPATPAGPTDTPNIHNAMGLEYILVPSFTDANDWFLVCDPADCPTIEIGFYQGREDPELFTQSDQTVGSAFNADKITWKIRHIYSGDIEDYRGFYRGQG